MNPLSLWPMKELLALKAKLERQLVTINDALKVAAEHGTSDDTPKRTKWLEIEDIQAFILTIPDQFTSADAEKQLHAKYLGWEHNPTAIPTALYQLTQDKKLNVLRPRKGRRGALYAVANQK